MAEPKKRGRPPKKKPELIEVSYGKPPECCARCRYWKRDGQYQEQFGTCRRYPVQPKEKKQGNDWCGEYQR
jgi:hypothetical protein